MDEGLIIGYDLCKDFCRVSYFDDNQEEPVDYVFSDVTNPYIVQNSVCKKKGQDTWLVGEPAYQAAIFGDGTMVDKLLKLLEMGGFCTIEGRTYTAEELMTRFLGETLKGLFALKGTHKINAIVFTVQELETPVLDCLMHCMKSLGIDRKKVHIISHTEAFLFFVMSQKRELWSNLAVLYDLTGDGLNYYEMEILRGIQPNVAYARRTFLEEGFSIDILESPSGERMADTIMTQCVDRMLPDKMVSSAFLSGNGMDAVQKWGTSFLKTICFRRRVFFIENLFAKGAVYAALDLLREKTAYPFSLICEGRVPVDISMEVFRGMTREVLSLARIGGNWYDTHSEFDVMLDDEKQLVLKVQKLGERLPARVEIPVSDFVERGSKKTRFGFSLAFTSENSFTVTLKDKGFGDFFPATDTVLKKTFTID